MRRINGLFFLILILATTAGGLIFWRLFWYQPTVTPPEISFPTPTPPQFIPSSPTPPQEGKGESPAALFRSLQERFPLAAFLPYETKTFAVDYIAPLSLKVEIKIATQAAQIKKEVLDWIWSKEVDPATHQIKYLTPAP